MTTNPGPAKRSRTLRHVLALGLAGLAAWYFIDFSEFWQTLRQVDGGWLLLMFLLATLDRFLMAGKWFQLLRHQGHPAGFPAVLSAYYQAAIVQRFLPSSLGGDALRALVISRRFGGTTGVLGTMVVEKLIAIVAAVFLATLGLVLALSQSRERAFIELLIVAPILLTVVLAGLRLSLHEPLARWMLKHVPGAKVRDKLLEVYLAYAAFRSAPMVLLRNFFYSCLEQSVQVLLYLASAIALQVDASPMTIIAAVAIAQCLRKFAILLEGWVFGEFTMVAVSGLLGIAASQALAFSLLVHAVAMAAALPGLWLFARSATTLGDLSARQPEREQQGI